MIRLLTISVLTKSKFWFLANVFCLGADFYITRRAALIAFVVEMAKLDSAWVLAFGFGLLGYELSVVKCMNNVKIYIINIHLALRGATILRTNFEKLLDRVIGAQAAACGGRRECRPAACAPII